MKTRVKNKIIVVAHDAGGAEVVGAYVNKNAKRYNFSSYISGPAEKVFARRAIVFQPAPTSIMAVRQIFDREIGISLLLAATSGKHSVIERLFVVEAKRHGIKSAVYLDHWVNFRERFGYPGKNWRENLPDEIWVGDQAARLLAKKLFKRPIILVPNLYFEEMKKQIKQFSQAESNSILFLGEPPHGPMVLKKFLSVLSEPKINCKIIIRPHPRELPSQYWAIVESSPSAVPVEISLNRSLAEDMGQSRLVVGIESLALAVAALAGKPAVSFRPGLAGQCRLPFRQIIKIKTAAALSKIIFDQK